MSNVIRFPDGRALPQRSTIEVEDHDVEVYERLERVRASLIEEVVTHFLNGLIGLDELTRRYNAINRKFFPSICERLERR